MLDEKFDYYLTHTNPVLLDFLNDKPAHFLVVAPPRSGTEASIIMPALLTWRHSCVVLDVNGEYWNMTAEWRKQNVGPVFCFDPCSLTGKSDGFNPLEEVRLDTLRGVPDAQLVASILADTSARGFLDFWESSASRLLIGVILFMLCKAQKENCVRSLHDIAKFLRNTGPQQIWNMWFWDKNYLDPADAQWKVHPAVEKTADWFIKDFKEDPRKASSHMSTALAVLSLWRDPAVACKTKKSAFRLSDLVNSDKPVTLYIVVPPAELSRLRPLLRLMLSQIVHHLTQTKNAIMGGFADDKHRHPLLFLLDDFWALGKMDLIERALPFFGHYDMRSLFVFNTYAQLRKVYGEDENISDFCKYHFVLDQKATPNVAPDDTPV